MCICGAPIQRRVEKKQCRPSRAQAAADVPGRLQRPNSLCATAPWQVLVNNTTGGRLVRFLSDNASARMLHVVLYNFRETLPEKH